MAEDSAAQRLAEAILLAFIVYRAMGWSGLYKTLQVTVRQSATVGLIVGAAFIVNYAVAIEGIPRTFVNAILAVSDDPLVLLILINLLFLVMGMFLDTMVLLLIMIPVVLPVLGQAGIDPVFFGVVIVLNMMIGLSTPPFGMLLFIVSSTTRTALQDVIREIRPFLAIMIAALAIVILFPDIVLFVPRLLGYKGSTARLGETRDDDDAEQSHVSRASRSAGVTPGWHGCKQWQVTRRGSGIAAWAS